ncbi:MAG TPA: sugar phosphate isomerase/epimerase family protein [Phycisphaerae bacterium]|nr:sugar phosphate isomerase/epimerase family protein [Phycisphaerae bacterium]HUT56970.1 sugar phosphate isomerase/epimerase family protein [Phycisphaerae bacterium]
MKYSFMSFSTPKLTLAEMLGLAKQLGYDGIEPRIDSGHAHGIELDAGPAARKDAARRSADAGIALCCVATSCKYADPATRDEMVQATLRCIDLAADVGAPRIRVFGGAIPESVSRADATAGIAEALKSVAGHAADRGVAVCIETHDDWCDPSQLAEVVRRADHPVVAVNWDIMHPVRAAGWTIDDAYRELRPWVRHLHVHDGTREQDKIVLKPIGDGIVDHKRALELLKADGYDGFISGEWIGWEPHEVHLPRELATLRRYESQV